MQKFLSNLARNNPPMPFNTNKRGNGQNNQNRSQNQYPNQNQNRAQGQSQGFKGNRGQGNQFRGRSFDGGSRGSEPQKGRNSCAICGFANHGVKDCFFNPSSSSYKGIEFNPNKHGFQNWKLKQAMGNAAQAQAQAPTNPTNTRSFTRNNPRTPNSSARPITGMGGRHSGINQDPPYNGDENSPDSNDNDLNQGNGEASGEDYGDHLSQIGLMTMKP